MQYDFVAKIIDWWGSLNCIAKLAGEGIRTVVLMLPMKQHELYC